ncbi:MAG: hypothetical protein JXB88_22105 [Spirochaetales bacterium]|nr:hypothetical protein [Spirochaetales bacterium]
MSRIIYIMIIAFLCLSPVLFADEPETSMSEETESDIPVDDIFSDIPAEIFSGEPAPGEVSPGFSEEKFSLYGYIVEYVQSNFIIENDTLERMDIGNTLYLRLKADFTPQEHLSFHSEIAYTGMTGNQNPYTTFGEWGLPVPPEDPYTHSWLDMKQNLSIDHLAASANLGPVDIQFGKLPLAWGTGYVFNPTAKTANLQFMDTVTEETPGTLAIATGISFSHKLSLQMYAAFQDRSHKLQAFPLDAEWDALPFGIKLQAVLGSFDVSGGFIKEVFVTGAESKRSYYMSADFAGSIWNFGVYGEATFLLPGMTDDPPFSFEGYEFKDIFEACIGFDYTIPLVDMILRGEYLHYGDGENNKSNYDITDLISGEKIMLGEDYLFVYLEKSFLDYFQFTIPVMINLNDGSLAFVPQFVYDVYSNFQLTVGGFAFPGPEGSEYNGEFFITAPVDITQPGLFIKGKLSF